MCAILLTSGVLMSGWTVWAPGGVGADEGGEAGERGHELDEQQNEWTEQTESNTRSCYQSLRDSSQNQGSDNVDFLIIIFKLCNIYVISI